MHDFQIYTMYVNGEDLLRHAIESTGTFQDKVVILDNSPKQDLAWAEFAGEIYRPCVPLFPAQSYNLISSLARERGQDLFFIMHSDAEASSEVIEGMLERAAGLTVEGVNWGVMFSNYDVLCLHNSQVLGDFKWDQYLPLYYTDVDFYYRLRVLGIQIVETGLPVGHMQGGSSTMKRDQALNQFVRTNYSGWHQYYCAKWGGTRDHEVFATPFNCGDVARLKG